jgi:hypothetical protein
MTAPDTTPDADTEQSVTTVADVATYFLLGLLAAVLLRPTSDPLDEIRQRVATLEGKLS